MDSDHGIHTLRGLIDRMAALRPDLPFAISPETGRVLTFKGLQEQALSLHMRFQAMGLAFGDKVAFLMDNGLFTAQLLLGTMYGGYVSVPLNVRAGVSQLTYTLDHSDAKVVFVDRQYDGLAKDVLTQIGRPVEVVAADVDDGAAWSAVASSIALPPVRAEDHALLMYTSGSTGQPKGAVHTHGSVLAHGRNSRTSHQLTEADRSLLVLPLYHINAECVTLVPTLLSGGSVVIPHGFVVGEFWNWVDAYRCTWSALVPTIISQLLDWKDPQAEQRGSAFARIRFLRSSSAPLSPSLHREFIDKFKLPLIQAMGSSEAGNVFSNPVAPGANKIGSPGLPWGFEARIVDRDGVELPAGEAGEVLLRGDGMMQGYYKDEAGTALALDAEGWLHTGDLAYRDEDGYFFVIGRSKELIIKGGVNIAPKQIDEILESHPAVLEAAAVGVPDRYVGEDVVAFAILRDGMRCDERELLSFCVGHLGHFKAPTRVHFVLDLPKGPSGKVQRLRLVEEAERLNALGAFAPAEGSAPSAQADGRVTTDLPLEQIIADIWSDLLRVPQLGPESNFFALGGQSLLALQYLSRLREQIPVMLSLSDFFEHATVAQQAALVLRKLMHPPGRQADGAGQFRAGPQPIPLRDRAVPSLLSPAQERVWFMDQLTEEEPAYNEVEAVRLKGRLSLEALEQAFNTIIARHEILRTTIESKDEQFVMVVQENWRLKLKRIELSRFPTDQQEAEIARLLIDEPRQRYNLESEPGIRVTVIALSGEEHVLILMMHHIVCDSSSLGILWRELGTQYEACLRGQPVSFPPLPIQYGDYAAWLRQPEQQAGFSEDLNFWREELQGAPVVLDLPADQARPPVMSYRGDKLVFQIDPALAEDLRQLCRQEKTSLFTVFAAAFNTLLYRYTDQDDILVGIPIADRERHELQPLIGFLLDTHVLRTDLSGNPTFQELMARVQKSVARVYSHRAAPFDHVVTALQPKRDLSYSPVFQVMLNWRDRDDVPRFIGLPGLTTEPLVAQSRISKFDLTLALIDTAAGIEFEFEYNTDLFYPARIERMFGHFRTMLEGIVADPEQRLADLPLLTQAERDQLLFDWNEVTEDEMH
jgi:acyl-CoA synthetase (AMP-forming)/AMP-acid ligase II